MGRSAKTFKAFTLLSFASAVAINAAAATPAHAQEARRNYDIPAQSLASAIIEFSRQSDVVVTAPSRLTKGKSAPAVRGSYSRAQALQRLIEGSGLRSRSARNGGFVLESAPRGNVAGTSGSQTASTVGEDVGAQEIVVTGTNIRGVTQIAAPTTTITRKDIEETPRTTLQDFLSNLPQNFTELSPLNGFAGGDVARSGVAQQNDDGSSGIDLLGLGADSTLVLVNGQRRALSGGALVVDISAIPLSAVDRIDIVTGGRSAIYGSDAVGGVVNITTRRKFDGAESRILVAGPTNYEGGRRFQASQVVGVERSNFGFVLSYDYSNVTALDLVKRGLYAPTTGAGQTNIRREAMPSRDQHAAFLAGEADLDANTRFTFDAGYSRSRSQSTGLLGVSGGQLLTTSDVKSTQFSIAPKLARRIGAWEVSAAAIYGQTDTFSYSVQDQPGYRSESLNRPRSAMQSVTLLAEGPLGNIGGMTPRVAVLGELRSEEIRRLRSTTDFFGGPGFQTVSTPIFRDRSIRSAAAELFLPFGDILPVGRLDISIAGRYDRYSDFGDTFNPQFGAVWAPGAGLVVKGGYGKSFRAPPLIYLADAAIGYIVPTDVGLGNEVPVFLAAGERSSLTPERATSWNAGFEYSPPFAKGLRISLSYVSVSYKDRLEVPIELGFIGEVLPNAARYAGVIDVSPTAATLDALIAQLDNGVLDLVTDFIPNPVGADILASYPGLVILDGRRANIATEKVKALMGSVDYKGDIGPSTVSFGVNFNFTLSHRRQISPGASPFSRLNQVGYPVDFKASVNAGWQQGPLGLYAQAHYAAGYRNQISDPDGHVKKNVTIDFNASLNGDKLPDGHFLRGWILSVGVQNLLDKDPPLVTDTYTGARFDAANGSPVGRVVSASIRKRF